VQAFRPGYWPGLLERGERRLDALALVFGDQAGKHLGIVTETEFE
jgi:hypothetical protein